MEDKESDLSASKTEDTTEMSSLAESSSKKEQIKSSDSEKGNEDKLEGSEATIEMKGDMESDTEIDIKGEM